MSLGGTASSRRERRAGPGKVLRFLAAAALVLGAAWQLQSAAIAQPRTPPLGGFKHVSWTMERGAPSRINALAQGRDGFLWVASVEGLFRFDGVRFERMEPDPSLPGQVVASSVMAARSGDVWVGLARSGGVAVFRNGRLSSARMPNPSREVNDIEEAPDGSVWVARGGRSRNTLARHHRGRWTEMDADPNVPEQPVWQIHFGRDGTMWVVFSQTVIVRRPGADRFEPTGESVTPRASLAEDPEGRIWVSDARSTRVLSAGRSAPVRTPGRAYPHAGRVGGIRMLFDRDGDLWGTTWNEGLFRIAAPGAPRSAPGGRAEVVAYGSADGLSSDQTHALLQDREGNIWAGTELGLDMFRRADLLVEQAIPSNPASSYRMAATRDGVVYIADPTTLFIIRPREPVRALLRLGSPAESLCAGAEGSVWAPLRDRVLQVKGSRVRSIPKPPGSTAYGCAEDAQGRFWMPGLENGLFVWERGRWRREPGLTSVAGVPGNAVVAPDGRAAVLFRTRPPALAGAAFTPIHRERLPVGPIESLMAAPSGLFVSGPEGLARIRGDGTRMLSSRRHPWLASVNGLAETPSGETWMIGDPGVVRVRSSRLDQAFSHPERAVPHRLFDFRDGLNSFPQKAPGAQIAAGADGRIWLLTRRNVISVDPARIRLNRTPPSVMVRSVSVGERRYRAGPGLTLPPRTTSVAITYTATSLAAPSRVQFSHRLQGAESTWSAPSNRREVRYTRLGPGRYRFRVIAANNDGVWNRTGAELSFRIRPAFNETWWFRALSVLAGGALLWLIYSLRVRYVTDRIRERLEERTQERERIARDLHDTLLQGVQGLIMRIQAVADQVPGELAAHELLETALDRAEQALVEGRDRLLDLRRANERELDALLREAIAAQPFLDSTQVMLSTDGAARPVREPVLDEIVRIAGEALFNAARHSDAKHVNVHVRFGAHDLEIEVRDDGKGMDLGAAGPRGHYGVVGMRERAQKLGAALTLSSKANAGTCVTLCLPARIAYVERSSSRGASRAG